MFGTGGDSDGESTVEIGSHYLSNTLGLKDHLKKEHLKKFGIRMFFGEADDTVVEANNNARCKQMVKFPHF